MQYKKNSAFKRATTAPKSYLYNFFKMITDSQDRTLSDENIHKLGLESSSIEISHVFSSEQKAFYYLMREPSVERAKISELIKILPNIYSYHISVYQDPYNPPTEKKSSDAHLTIEYVTHYMSGATRKPHTTHFYYEIVPSQTQPILNLIRIHNTERSQEIPSKLIDECNKIMELYILPVVQEQNRWFETRKTECLNKETELRNNNTLLCDLLSTTIYKKEIEKIGLALHSSQRSVLQAKATPLSEPQQNMIMEQCEEILLLNITNLLQGDLDASTKLQELKASFVSSMNDLKIELAYVSSVDRLERMIKRIDLYQFNDFNAISDLMDEQRQEFKTFLLNSFLDPSKNLSFNNILRVNDITDKLRSFAELSVSDTSENLIHEEYLQICNKLEEFDIAAAIQQRAGGILNELERDPRRYQEFKDEITSLQERYSELRKVLGHFYNKSGELKTPEDNLKKLATTYTTIRDNLFLMPDFFKNKDDATDLQRSQEALLTTLENISKEPDQTKKTELFVKLLNDIVSSYQNKYTGCVGRLLKKEREILELVKATLLSDPFNHIKMPKGIAQKRAC